MKRVSMFTALFILCAALAGAASAQDARILALSGEVQVRAEGQGNFVPAKAGGALLFGDSVRTGAGAVAHISLQSGPIVLIREKSAMTLQGNPRKTTLSFTLGEFLIGIKQRLAARSAFRVRTPSAVCSVRGTLFWGKTDEKKTTTYAGFENEVMITAQGRAVTLKPGQTLSVPYGKPPEEPKPHAIPAEYMKNFAVEGSLQGIDELAGRK